MPTPSENNEPAKYDGRTGAVIFADQEAVATSKEISFEELCRQYPIFGPNSPIHKAYTKGA
jgi:hypothetical protein